MPGEFQAAQSIPAQITISLRPGKFGSKHIPKAFDSEGPQEDSDLQTEEFSSLFNATLGYA
jgi:hypothetical protein